MTQTQQIMDMTTDLERVHQQENQPALHFGSFNFLYALVGGPHALVGGPPL